MDLAELGESILKAKHEWQKAKLELEQARVAYEYTTRRLRLVQDEFHLELGRYPDWVDAVVDNLDHNPASFFSELNSVHYVGMTLGEACRDALKHRARTAAELADYLRTHGFEFGTDAPAREVHAGLLKQVWAQKDEESGTWKIAPAEGPGVVWFGPSDPFDRKSQAEVEGEQERTLPSQGTGP